MDLNKQLSSLLPAVLYETLEQLPAIAPFWLLLKIDYRIHLFASAVTVPSISWQYYRIINYIISFHLLRNN